MSAMDAQQKRQRGIILGIGGPIVVVFLLAQLSGADAFVLWVVGIPLLLLFLVIRALVRVGDKRPAPVELVSPAPVTAAGWYPDQQDPTLMRWFDGQVWTGATLPR